MAQVEEKPGGRNSNVDLNLVPFIDLMSVLITFLLITAVWTQVSMIKLGSTIYSKKNSEVEPTPPPLEKPDIVLRLDVLQTGYRLLVGKNYTTIPVVGTEFDNAKLTEELKKVKQRFPEKDDAVVSMSEALPYNNLIVAMDGLLQSGFDAISIATSEVE